MSSVSIVVVSFEVRARLLEALRSLDPATDEVVVVDNASSDGTVDALRQELPWVRVLPQARNLGFGAACNLGVGAARGDVVLLLNPDARIAAEDVARVPARLEALRAGAVGFRLVGDAGHWQLSLGPPPNLALEAVRTVVQRGLDRDTGPLAAGLDRLLGASPRRVPWVAGAALAMRRSDFLRVGGFDERFFLYFEDIDLCLRIGREVGPIYYDPTITVAHAGGASARRAVSLARRAYRESQVYFWQKHGGWLARRLVPLYVRAWPSRRREWLG